MLCNLAQFLVLSCAFILLLRYKMVVANTLDVQFSTTDGKSLFGYYETYDDDQSINIICEAISFFYGITEDLLELRVLHSDTNRLNSFVLVGNRGIILRGPLDIVLECYVNINRTFAFPDEVNINPALLFVRIRPAIRLAFGIGHGGESHRGKPLIQSPAETSQLNQRSIKQWLSICGDDFNEPAALVLCRQLGFYEGRSVSENLFPSLDKSIAKQIVGMYHHNFRCNGSERNIFSCDVNNVIKCNSEAAVECSRKTWFSSQAVVIKSNYDSNKINLKITVKPEDRPFYLVGDIITVSCLLRVQMPADQTLNFIRIVNPQTNSSIHQSQPILVSIDKDEILYNVSYTYQNIQALSVVNEFHCHGIDNISGKRKVLKKRVLTQSGLQKVMILAKPGTNLKQINQINQVLWCMADKTTPPPKYVWIKKLHQAFKLQRNILSFLNQVYSVVSVGQRMRFEPTAGDKNVVEICCHARQQFNGKTFNASKCIKLNKRESNHIFLNKDYKFNLREGVVHQFTVPKTGCYHIQAFGASGGHHSSSYGRHGGGNWRGGQGAAIFLKVKLIGRQVLNMIIGNPGGNNSELAENITVHSFKTNAGSGGGGGTFVFTRDKLIIAAGGGGGATYGRDGGPGQTSADGGDALRVLSRKMPLVMGYGGHNGSSGFVSSCSLNNCGGAGAGWFGEEYFERVNKHQGEQGHGKSKKWYGGLAGLRNSGAVGGFGGGGGGGDDKGGSGGGGGYSGGGPGAQEEQAGAGGGSFCLEASSCQKIEGGNLFDTGMVIISSKTC